MEQGSCRICNEGWSDGKDIGLFTLIKEEQLRNDSAFLNRSCCNCWLWINEKDSSIHTIFLELKRYSTVLLQLGIKNKKGAPSRDNDQLIRSW